MTDFNQKKQKILEIISGKRITTPEFNASKALDALYLEELVKHQANYKIESGDEYVDYVPIEAIKELLGGKDE